MSVQSALFDRLNSAFYNRQYILERSTDSESIKPEDIVALYLKIMTSSSALIICKMLMSISEVSDALWFKEKNITDFLKTFNNMCDNHSIESVEQLKKICCYCKRHIYEYICSLVGLKKNN